MPSRVTRSIGGDSPTRRHGEINCFPHTAQTGGAAISGTDKDIVEHERTEHIKLQSRTRSLSKASHASDALSWRVTTMRMQAALLFVFGLLCQQPGASYAGSTFLLALLFHSELTYPLWKQAIIFQWLPLAASKAIASLPYFSSVLPASESFFLTFALALPITLVYVLTSKVGHLVGRWIPLGLPFIWALGDCLLARLTPLGRFASWPGASDTRLIWLAQYFGFPALSFLQASLAYAAAEILALAWKRDRQPLILGEDGELEQQEARWKSAHRHPFTLFTLLVALMSFSSFSVIQSTDSFKVGCVLPEEDSLASFLHESRVSASRGSRVILWPETAVILYDNAAYQTFQTQLHDISTAYDTLLAATYSRPVNGKRTNSMDLYGRSTLQPIFTYQKMHLLPYVESFPTLKNEEGVPTAEVNLSLASHVSRHRNKIGTVTLVPQICQDTSFPVLDGPRKHASLELVSSAVPSLPLALARLQEMRVRAIERDTSILICDASPRGISGLVDSSGTVRYLQTGVQRTFEVEVPYTGKSSSWYSSLGDSGSLAVLLGIVLLVTGLGRISERGEELIEVGQELKQRVKSLLPGSRPLIQPESSQGRLSQWSRYLFLSRQEEPNEDLLS